MFFLTRQRVIKPTTTPARTRLRKWFRARYYFTAESVGVTGLIMSVWLLSYYLMSVFSNIASSRSPDNSVYPQLPDIGFAILPQLDTLWMTDLFDAILVLPTIVLIFTHRKPAYVGITWMLTSTLCNFERIASVAITSFPDPRPGCEKISDHFLSKVSAHKCGDCMFSGHTVLFVICACAWTTYTPVRRRSFARTFIVSSVWALVAAGSAVVIMNRAHYTVDVLIAWYVGIGNWFTVQYLWKEHCIRKGYLKSINWPAHRLLLVSNDSNYRKMNPDDKCTGDFILGEQEKQSRMYDLPYDDEQALTPSEKPQLAARLTTATKENHTDDLTRHDSGMSVSARKIRHIRFGSDTSSNSSSRGSDACDDETLLYYERTAAAVVAPLDVERQQQGAASRR